MAYTTQSRIEDAIPAPVLVDALDDDRDGMPDDGKLDSIIGTASNAVDSYLSGLFETPFDDPAPAPVQEAAFVFACELIYQRRAVGEKENPFTKRAEFWRKRLEMIGNRELPLDAAIEKTNEPGAAITDSLGWDAQGT